MTVDVKPQMMENPASPRRGVVCLPTSFLTLAHQISTRYLLRMNAKPKLLLLHAITSSALDFSATSITRFNQLITIANSLNMQFATVDECLRDRTKIALTFDDGYDDLLQIADQVRDRNIPVHVFIPTSFIGKPNTWDNFINRGKRRHLNGEQIRSLISNGFTFGSHSHTHRDLTSLSQPQLENELTTSKKLLSDITDREVTTLALPFGLCNKRVMSTAQNLGFTQFFLSTPSRSSTKSTSIYGRIPITRFDNAISLRIKLSDSPLSSIESLKSKIVSRFSYLTPITR